MSRLDWKRRNGIHFGRITGGTVDNERERQLRMRTYYIRRGTGLGEFERRSRFYVSHNDGTRDTDRSIGVGFRSLQNAKYWCERDLVDSPPKVKLVFKGRDSRGNLVWSEPGKSTFTVNYTVDPEKFYEAMVR